MYLNGNLKVYILLAILLLAGCAPIAKRLSLTEQELETFLGKGIVAMDNAESKVYDQAIFDSSYVNTWNKARENCVIDDRTYEKCIDSIVHSVEVYKNVGECKKRYSDSFINARSNNRLDNSDSTANAKLNALLHLGEFASDTNNNYYISFVRLL